MPPTPPPDNLTIRPLTFPARRYNLINRSKRSRNQRHPMKNVLFGQHRAHHHLRVRLWAHRPLSAPRSRTRGRSRSLRQASGTRSPATPNWFQGEACDGTTAEYTLRDDGTIRVENRCADTDTARRGCDRRHPRGSPTSATRASSRSVSSAPSKATTGSWRSTTSTTNGPSSATRRAPSSGSSAAHQRWTPTSNEDILARLPEWGYDPSRLRTTYQPDA